MLRYYLKEAFEPSLLFGFFSTLLGVSTSYYYGRFRPFTDVILFLGVIAAQMSVNVLNDYIDYKKSVDLDAVSTKFSGGSELIKTGKISKHGTLAIGIASFLIAVLIGLFFAISQPIIVPLIIIGAISIIMYTDFFVKVPFASEFSVGFNFFLIAIGSFIVSGKSTLGIYPILIPALAIGLAMGMASFINSMPDVKADKKNGRKTSNMLIKSKINKARYYLYMIFLAYILILVGVIYSIIPFTILIVILVSWLPLIVAKGIRKYQSPKGFERYMGINLIFIISFMLLCSVGFVV